MSKKVRNIIIIALSLVLLVSGGMVVFELLQYKAGQDEYAKAEELAKLPDFSRITPAPVETEQAQPDSSQPPVVYVDPYADELQNMDFSALQQVNPDVRGWILIPGTVVSYPLLYGEEKESTYYLNHTWSGSYGVVGSIFIDKAVDPGFSGFNTVIYGHNMNNGSMFASIRNYSMQSYADAHPNIYITDENGARCYEVFAAYEVKTDGDTYTIGFSSDEKKQEFLDFCVGSSAIKTSAAPTVDDSVITLSTCTGRGHETRWVVQAVCKQ